MKKNDNEDNNNEDNDNEDNDNEDNDNVVHCCTLSLCYLGAETDDQHRNPNTNTEIIYWATN